MVMTRNSEKHGRHDSRQLMCAQMRKAWEEGWMEVEREREFWESEREGDWKRGKGQWEGGRKGGTWPPPANCSGGLRRGWARKTELSLESLEDCNLV